jgi:Transmembrane exosortase (Exosortase_EpsH)
LRLSAVLDHPALIPPPWRAALLRLALLWLAVFVLYGDALRSMVVIWSRSDTFAHGFLVAPISAWLVWRQRERLRGLVPGLMPWMALPMAARPRACWPSRCCSCSSWCRWASS